MKSNKILASRNGGEKTVEGRGYEPYEAVRSNALIPLITEGYSYIVVVLFFRLSFLTDLNCSFMITNQAYYQLY